jgi:SAM-dependent methyltransferase
MDYGCGTGLLTVLLSARLGHVVAVDNSQEMLEVLAGKLRDLGIGNIEVRCLDLTTEATPDERFDLIFSSMALHHMSEPAALVGTLAGLMRPGGYLAIADLDAEDGSFHGEAAGEVHHGFSEAQMRGFMGGAGLTDPEVGVAHVMTREEADGGVREYRVLLTVAQKG